MEDTGDKIMGRIDFILSTLPTYPDSFPAACKYTQLSPLFKIKQNDSKQQKQNYTDPRDALGLPISVQ